MGDGTVNDARGQRRVALLGPQHATPTLRGVLDEAELEGPYVLVAAGWEEREAETGALEAHLGEPVENLGCWPECEAAFERDPELKRLMFERYDRMRELGRIYRVRLSAELDALRTLLGRTDPAQPDELVGPSLGPAFEALQALDAHHRARIDEVNRETFEAAWACSGLAEGTERMRSVLEGAGTLLIAGGHVGILYNRMHLFRVLENLPEGVGAAGWSAGAMVLTDSLLLFHDSPPRGAGDAEIHGPGFGEASGITVLPHASTRLALEDRTRVALLARRMGDSQVIALDGGQSVLLREDGSWSFGAGARRLMPTGDLVAADEALVAASGGGR